MHKRPTSTKATHGQLSETTELRQATMYTRRCRRDRPPQRPRAAAIVHASPGPRAGHTPETQI